MVSDRDSFLTARRVTREEGILVGGSAGTAVWAAARGRPRARRPTHVVVVLHPRLGPRLPVQALQRRVDGRLRLPARRRARPSATCWPARAPTCPPSCTCTPTRRCATAIAHPARVRRVADAGGAGRAAAGRRRGARRGARARPARAGVRRPVGARPAGRRGDGPAAADASAAASRSTLAVERLESAPAVLVLDGGHPVGILTRSDLLEFLTPETGRRRRPTTARGFETRAIHAGQRARPGDRRGRRRRST